MFKYWCKARANKMEETSLKYALLAQVVRDGGFKIPIIMRFSAFPGHCEFPLCLPSFQLRYLLLSFFWRGKLMGRQRRQC